MHFLPSKNSLAARALDSRHLGHKGLCDVRACMRIVCRVFVCAQWDGDNGDRECIRLYNMGHTHECVLSIANECWWVRARARTPNLEHKPSKTRLGFLLHRSDWLNLSADTIVAICEQRPSCAVCLCTYYTNYVRLRTQSSVAATFYVFHLIPFDRQQHALASTRTKNWELRTEKQLKVSTEMTERENGPSIAYVAATYFIQSTCARPAQRFRSFRLLLLCRLLLLLLTFSLFYFHFTCHIYYLRNIYCRACLFCHCLCARIINGWNYCECETFVCVR